jgi:predicted AlkP superfamily pyrophosphatase or phosphodiesterase
MMTGVWPAKHGIENNISFDPEGRNLNGWNWYAEDIRVPTLWKVAADAGLTVGSISWPVSVAAPGIHFGIPEYWRAVTRDDLKLVKAISTPGLLSELEKDLGRYILDLDDSIPGDWMRTRYAEAILKKKKADVFTLHLAALDHLEHAAGPFSPEAFATLEAIDEMVGVLEKAMLQTHPDGTIAIVSDHGFARTDHQLHLAVAFVQAGLITPNAKRTSLSMPAITDWKAQVWSAGGSALIMLRDPKDEITRNAVRRLLSELAADARNGIAKVLDRVEISKLGGGTSAEFVVDMKPGYLVGPALEGPMVRSIKPGGTHGYSPVHPEMNASLFLSGKLIEKGTQWGEVDMRSIAPTLAKCLGLTLPSADLPPLKGIRARVQ